MFISKQDQLGKVHPNAGSVTRPGIPLRVVISAASATTVSAGTNRNHVQDTRAMETLLAHLSHLLGFKMEHSFFFVGIPCVQTRTVKCKTVFRVARSNKIM